MMSQCFKVPFCFTQINLANFCQYGTFTMEATSYSPCWRFSEASYCKPSALWRWVGWCQNKTFPQTTNWKKNEKRKRNMLTEYCHLTYYRGTFGVNVQLRCTQCCICIRQGRKHAINSNKGNITPKKFEHAALFLQLGIPFKVIRHANPSR